ncbi:MAG: anhydro-N-acetylmuramic acid kinase [Candidatus Pelagibacterales bacterium]|nr:MAG: anhydro-N-acetylmuramic acid kinase [Pelagibacterales bacterium]
MKSYYSLGLMSGTSADGVDASIIQSDGDTEYKVMLERYFKYDQNIYNNIHDIKEQINNSKDLTNLSKKIGPLQKEITIFHANVVNEISKEFNKNIDFVGFHGQTIFHNAKEKISKQLGDGKLLSQLTKKTIIYDFRQNDIKNGGHGAPLTPIFHKLLKKKFKIREATFVNIGGITNVTTLWNVDEMSGTDIGPGMCLIDRLVRNNINKNYDEKGLIAKSGKINKIVLKKMITNFYQKENSLDTETIQSFDTKYFDFSFVKDLLFKDAIATLTEFTAQIIISALKKKEFNRKKIILCGGGRKNNFLVNRLKKVNKNIKLIDEYGIDGDFIESQAFAYIAIRSYIKMPISFPMTTGCLKPCTGGKIIKN